MPILTGSGGGQNVVVAAAVVKFFQLLLADRSSLRGHPALINLGAYGAGRLGSGSLTHQFPVFGLDGYDMLSSVSEGAETSETALTNAAKTIALARRGMYREYSDIMNAVDSSGVINSPRLAIDGFMSAMVTLTNLIALQADDFANQVGTTGVDFDHDMVMEAKATLIEEKVPGPYLGVFHLNHFSRWIIDLESRGGLTQWRPATEQMQMLRGPGFQGIYDNIEIWTSDKNPTSGSDKVSMIIGRGAIGYAEQEMVLPRSAFGILQEGPIAIEEIRTGRKGLTGVQTHYHVGVNEIEDERGVGILAAA